MNDATIIAKKAPLALVTVSRTIEGTSVRMDIDRGVAAVALASQTANRYPPDGISDALWANIRNALRTELGAPETSERVSFTTPPDGTPLATPALRRVADILGRTFRDFAELARPVSISVQVTENQETI